MYILNLVKISSVWQKSTIIYIGIDGINNIFQNNIEQ